MCFLILNQFIFIGKNMSLGLRSVNKRINRIVKHGWSKLHSKKKLGKLLPVFIQFFPFYYLMNFKWKNNKYKKCRLGFSQTGKIFRRIFLLCDWCKRHSKKNSCPFFWIRKFEEFFESVWLFQVPLEENI